jgi:hypothetical protein
MDKTHALDSDRLPLCGRAMVWDKLKSNVSQQHPTCIRCAAAKAKGAKLFDLGEYEAIGKRLPSGSDKLRAQLQGKARGPKPKWRKGLYLPRDYCPECDYEDDSLCNPFRAVHRQTDGRHWVLEAHYQCPRRHTWRCNYSGDYRDRISFDEAVAQWARGERT